VDVVIRTHPNILLKAASSPGTAARAIFGSRLKFIFHDTRVDEIAVILYR
jgi:hypothetical protein